MLDKLSGDAVEPDQLAQLHDIGRSQPLRPGAEASGGSWGKWCWGGVLVASIVFKSNFYADIGRNLGSRSRTQPGEDK